MSSCESNFSGDPELLIVDDALAAVDGHVANTIFENVLWKRKRKGLTTIVAINQLHFLPRFDRVLYLNKNTIQHAGTYDEVYKISSNFRDLIASGDAANHDLDDVEDKDESEISDPTNTSKPGGDIEESAKSIREEGEKKNM